MKAATCTTCGTTVPDVFAKRGRVCPTCLILAAQPPRREENEPAGLLTSRWAESFPQYELEELLLEAGERRAWTARDLEANRRPVVLQVVSGSTLDDAGGASTLLLRANRLRTLDVPGLVRVLDAGELSYAFFLVTERHESWEAVSPGLDPTDAGALDRLLTRASGILAIVRQDGLALPFDLATTFRDPATDRVFLTPSALPADTVDDAAAVQARPVILAPGTEVGGFLLEEKVGEGGFGEVWRAWQNRPVKRPVALKILKQGLASPRLLARFEVEQQSLAKLDHPHIARFFEGGSTSDGRPWFAMEWIEGQSLDHFCAGEPISLEERLRLFGEIGEAVHHAHQKGLIHRDLKPSNVMVTCNGDSSGVKVIDFGIARTMEAPGFDQTQLTRAEEIVGTPAAMSPEQASGATGSDLDARTDVYGLGVLLYELLTGQLPFDPKLPADELRRSIREDDPPRPSSRTATPEDRRQLRGDLDWIVMRCLEKEPERRYRSVNALLRELDRHEKNEPIEAGPPTIGYRVRKFVRRNQAAVSAACGVVIALVAGLLFSIAGYRAAKENEEQAKRNLAASEEARNEAEAVSQFVYDLLDVEGGVSADSQLAFEDLLAHAATLLDRETFPAPERWAELQELVASLYSNRGRTDLAIPLREEIRNYHLKTKPPGNQARTAAEFMLARSYRIVGRYRDAIAIQTSYLASLRAHPQTEPWELIGAAGELVALYDETSDHESKAHYARIVRETFEEHYSEPASSPYPRTACRYLRALTATGQFERAIAAYKAWLPELEREFGTDSAETLEALEGLASAFTLSGQSAECLEIRRIRHERLHRRLGPTNPETLTARYYVWAEELEACDTSKHVPASVITSGEQIMEDLEDHLGPSQAVTLLAARNLTVAYRRNGQLRKLSVLLERLLPAVQSALAVGDWKSRLPIESLLAQNYIRLGENKEAYALTSKVLLGLHAAGAPATNPKAIDAHLRAYYLKDGAKDRRTKVLPYVAGAAHLEQGNVRKGRSLLLLSLIHALLDDPLIPFLDEPFTSGDLRFRLISDLSSSPALRATAPSKLLPFRANWAVYYQRPESPAPPDWNMLKFDDSSWFGERAPFTTGDQPSLPCVFDRAPTDTSDYTLCLRNEFEVERDLEGRKLILELQGGLGTAVFLNGTEVGKIPDQYDVEAWPESDHLSFGILRENDSFALSAEFSIESRSLREGTNVIAVRIPPQPGKARWNKDVSATLPSDDPDPETYTFVLRLKLEEERGLAADLAEVIEGCDPSEALGLLQQETGLQLDNLPTNWKPRVLAALAAIDGHWEDALKLTQPVIENCAEASKEARVLGRFRSLCLQRLQRTGESYRELRKGVPDRLHGALDRHVDLSEYYTAYLDETPILARWGGGSFANGFFPANIFGVLEAGSLSFETRGLIHLQGAQEVQGGFSRRDRIIQCPNAMQGIEVSRPASILHFLHTGDPSGGTIGPVWSNKEIIATYEINYEDGHTASIPVRAGKDLHSFWHPASSPPQSAWWTGNSPIVGNLFCLYVQSWINPRPNVPIKTIDVVSAEKETALMLFGITADPVGEPNLSARSMEDAVLQSGLDLTTDLAQKIFFNLGTQGVAEENVGEMGRAAWALALGEDRERFLTLSRQMRDRLADSDDVVELRQLARTLLLPAARDDTELVAAGIEAARKASEMTPDHHLVPVEQVLSAYRMGNYTEAWSILESTPRHESSYRTRMLLLLRAMAAFQLGKGDEAKAALWEVRPLIEESMDQISSEGFSPGSHRHFIHRAFLDEAEKLVEEGASTQ